MSLLPAVASNDSALPGVVSTIRVLPAVVPAIASHSLPTQSASLPAQQPLNGIQSSASEMGPIVNRLETPIDGSIVWDYLFRDHTFALSQPRTASQVVDYCYRHINRRRTSMGIVVFKIGVAADPEDRFNNLEFGYALDGYMFMDVLWRGAPRDCAVLEDKLITLFKPQRGCRNVNPGGGGFDANNNSYQSHVYVVFAPCGDGISIMAAARKRRRLSC